MVGWRVRPPPTRVTAARRLRGALVLAAIAALVAFWIHFHTLQPGTAFRMLDADPEMAYFVSSLAVFDGQPYALVQHPGTPLLALGTVLMAALAPFAPPGPGGITTRMVMHPEMFIVAAHVLLAAACALCVAALGCRAIAVRRASDAVLAAAVAASYFAFLPDAFNWTFYWSHNAVAFPAGTALLLASLQAHRRGRPLGARTASWLGVGAGVLTATQLFFATWIFGLVVSMAAMPLLRRRELGKAIRPVLAVIAGAALGFAVCFIPALPNARIFVDFLHGLVTHQGDYGTGPAGFTSTTALRANLRALYEYSPSLFIAQGAVLVALAVGFAVDRARRGRAAGWWAAALGLAAQWAATVLVLAKQPGPFYLPALAALLPPMLAIAFQAWRRRGDAARLACLAAAVVALAGCALGAARTVDENSRRNAFRAAASGEVAGYRSGLAAARGVAPESTLLLWGPGVEDAGCYALWMGTQYSKGALARQVSQACPSEGLAWSNAVVVPQGWPADTAIRALIVTTEDMPRSLPALAAFGTPELGKARNAQGQCLAFFPVTVTGGRAIRD
jgi:hypothetical protein